MLLRQVAPGKPAMAGMLATLTGPMPGAALVKDGRHVMAPLGTALFIDAAGDWSGAFDRRGEGPIALAGSYGGCLDDDGHRATRVLRSAYDGGRMASDPFERVRREDLEACDMLECMWTRSGGDPAAFDDLIPPDAPYGWKSATSPDREAD